METNCLCIDLSNDIIGQHLKLFYVISMTFLHRFNVCIFELVARA